MTLDLPKINKQNRRDTIVAVAQELARMDGYVFTNRAFEWLRQHPEDREGINPRSVWYVRKALAVYKIIKNQTSPLE